jgi:hypothetical protein
MAKDAPQASRTKLISVYATPVFTDATSACTAGAIYPHCEKTTSRKYFGGDGRTTVAEEGGRARSVRYRFFRADCARAGSPRCEL